MLLSLKLRKHHKEVTVQKQNKINSVFGLVILFAVVVFGNLMVNNMSVRKDITEEKLFTLSDGSRSILEDLSEPVTFKFFYSKSLEGVPPQLKNYCKRVLSLLSEYVEASDEMNIEIIDPEPDSEDEEIAQRYGIKGQQIAPGVNFYFGLVVTNVSGEEVLPYFDMSRERFLEYDITRSIYLLNLVGKPKVGILSSLDVLGVEAPQPQFGMPPMPNAPKSVPPWMVTHELKKFYDLQKVDVAAETIPSDLNLLVVMHAKDLSEKMQYAIDQYVMSGKNIIFFVDPMYIKDRQGQNQFQPPKPNTSLDKIFAKWGIDYSASKVTLDPELAAQVRTGNHPAILRINNKTVSKEDIVTAQLSSLVMLFPGLVGLKDDVKDVTFTALISSSNKAKTQDKMKVMYSQPDSMMSGIKEEEKQRAISGLFSGKFKSAFDKAPAGISTPHIAESIEETSIIVTADMDMLEDDYCMQPIQIMGQVLGYRPLNQNSVFLSNTFEKMVGNKALISLRSRGKFQRPFDKVTDMENKAREKWKKREEELQKELNELETQINSRLKKQGQNQQIILSSEDTKSIEKFKEKRRAVNKELRQVRKNLRGDIVNLGTRLKAINILFAPLLVVLFGCFIAFSKSRRIAG